MKRHAIALLLDTSLALTALSACKASQQTTKTTTQTKTYVSDGYNKRKQGYDWVAVETTKQANNTLKVQIRSRADKKKPTCTFDGIAYPVNANLYQLKQGDMTLNLILNAKSIDIEPAQENDRNQAMYHFSGGGSLIGSYEQVVKIEP